jgi:AcrR family transcriptional regulator
MATTLNRRDRVRAATVTEIKETARRILVSEGPDGLSLRAIAREMGMTAPALYRYFPSREELVGGLIADLYDELGDAIEAARDAVDPPDPREQLAMASRAFRTWALANRREFGLLFGSPMPGLDAPGPSDGGPAGQAAERFGLIFGALIAAIYSTDPFPIPAEAELDPVLRQELRAWCSAFPAELPVGAARVFMSCWIRLYGMVAMEVFGHLKFALSDAEPMFEAELGDLARMLGFGPP